MRRGEVWSVDLGSTRGSRVRKTCSAVVLTPDALNRVRQTVVVVPFPIGPGPQPPIIVDAPSVGLGNAAMCDQVRTVSKDRLTRCTGQLTPADLHGIENGVRAVLGL